VREVNQWKQIRGAISTFCQLLAICGTALFTSGCRNNSPGTPRTYPVHALYYISNSLLSSADFTNAVGLPPTNDLILKEDAEAVKQAAGNAPPGSRAYLHASTQEALSVNVVNGVLGPWFQIQTFPVTSNLLQNAFEDTWLAAHRAKDIHFRHRPDPLIPTSSYPSAHAAEGAVLAAILLQLDPQCQPALDTLTKDIGRNRLILQKHYPSDVKAGQALGTWLADKIQQSEKFRNELEVARQELAPHLQRGSL
jgi:acid phosphatase (class A)